MYARLLDESIPLAVVSTAKKLLNLDDFLAKYKALLSKCSPTVNQQVFTNKLWLRYIENVKILTVFIRAEKTGDRPLQLITIRQILNCAQPQLSTSTMQRAIDRIYY